MKYKYECDECDDGYGPCYLTTTQKLEYTRSCPVIPDNLAADWYEINSPDTQIQIGSMNSGKGYWICGSCHKSYVDKGAADKCCQ